MKISKYKKIFGMGPLGMVIGLVLLGLLWLLDRALNHVEILTQPKPLRIIGLCFIALWMCWHVWCLRTIRLWWNEDRLCTTGPYRFVRHPIYAGGTLVFGIGLALILNSWILLLWPILGCLTWSVLVRKEEKMMETVFGDEYTRYAARTGGLLPRLFRKSPPA